MGPEAYSNHEFKLNTTEHAMNAASDGELSHGGWKMMQTPCPPFPLMNHLMKINLEPLQR